MSQRPPVTDWSSDFDHLDPRWINDPYPIWDELRQKCPVAHTERFSGVYLPTRYEDIRAVAYDTEHFSSRRITIREGNGPVPVAPPVSLDPPEHHAARKVLLPAFTPTAVEKLVSPTREFCRALLQPLAGRTSCDGAVEYAQEVPARVTAVILGLSASAGDLFRRWLHEYLVLGVTDPAVLRRVLAEIEMFFGDQIEKRRMAPGDDLISFLLKARIDDRPLSKQHLIGTLRVLLFAGIDTTWNVIGASLWHLAAHDDDRRRLVAEPQLIPTAIEEFLRAYAPAAMGREIVRDTEIGGRPVKAGEMVMLAYGAANRDPAAFPDADRVVIDRADNRHAAFGLGIHRCIGSTLARMEIRVALEEWLAVFPEFRVAEGAVVEWSAGQLRGPRRLPLTLGKAITN